MTRASRQPRFVPDERTRLESEIQREIRLELGDLTRYPELILSPNVCGVFLDEHSNTKRRVGVFNPGGSDLIGGWTAGARWSGERVEMPARPFMQLVGLEIKSATGRQQDEQKQFEQLITSRGGVYAVVRSVEDARKWAESMRSGR